MSIRVTWLNKGHISHGYRRVFAMTKENTLIHVVVFVPMSYESVYHIQRQAKDTTRMTDPSLWWGLSAIAKLISDKALFADSDTLGDDGYLQTRPPLPTESELLPVAVYDTAVSQGYIDLDQLGGLPNGTDQ